MFPAGTPSLAEPSTVEAVLTTVRDCAELKSGPEITLEANPTSAQRDKLRCEIYAPLTLQMTWWYIIDFFIISEHSKQLALRAFLLECRL